MLLAGIGKAINKLLKSNAYNDIKNDPSQLPKNT